LENKRSPNIYKQNKSERFLQDPFSINLTSAKRTIYLQTTQRRSWVY